MSASLQWQTAHFFGLVFVSQWELGVSMPLRIWGQDLISMYVQPLEHQQKIFHPLVWTMGVKLFLKDLKKDRDFPELKTSLLKRAVYH